MVRPATRDELAAIRALLMDADLPANDLETSKVQLLVMANADGIAGAIGVELFETAGLLRSLVVAPAARGRGHGAVLVKALEHEARCRGLSQLILLTETAAPFFSRLGYATAPRGAMPASVQASTEFRSLCPASATCMAKSLDIL